jgi:hypothetical protein
VRGLRRSSAYTLPAVWLGRYLRGDDPLLSIHPCVHVNYESTVLPMKDGLAKVKDFPEEFGGSGVTLPE